MEILLVYRENDLFQEYIPEVIETLTSLGHQVKTHSFPLGTDKVEIRKWAQEHKNEFKNRAVMVDGTFRRAISYELQEELDVNSLDEFFDKATEMVVLGTDYKELLAEMGSSDMETTGKAYYALIQRILESKENLPEKVYVRGYHILDHNPFYSLIQSLKDDIKKAEAVAVETLKKWLVEGGIPAGSILFYEGEKGEVEIGAGDWIIADRHIIEWVYKGHPTIILEMPFSNFYRSAQKQGLIKLRPREIEKNLRKLLREKFST